ncbi:MAG: hypothetical protein JF615_16740 [Asticcacaulis sp.]|nr:hypothetical protein [Asticcacaulis sp.]
MPVELGINRVLLRATTVAGKVHLEASADGLKGASLDTISHAVPLKDGLSSAFAEDYQPSDLSRGPTPFKPSFTPFRRAVDIASITAGSNTETAGNSHDDNETTTWTSDGRPETAWIEYRFAHPDTPETLSLRLTGWRLRTYPIRVTVDETVVYEGTTPKSLGYVDLALKSVTGKRLRIELIGATEDRDAFGKIIELRDNKEAQSVGADHIPAGMTLSIVEADVLAKAATGK